MTTLIEFELNGIKYNESNGRYYKTEDGKKTRIGKATYEEAAAEWTEMVKGKAEQNAEQDEIDTITAEMTGKNEEQADMTQTVNKAVELTVKGIVEYTNSEEGQSDSDRFTKAEDVENCADRFGWDDEISAYAWDEIASEVEKMNDSERAAFDAEVETKITKGVIDALFSDQPTKPIKVKKQSKPRKSKDIAHESKHGVTLTAKQVDFLWHLPDSDFWTDGLDSEIWVDCLCDEIGGQFFNKPMTVGAMISTLCEKKLGVRCRQKVNGRTATSFKLTDLGKMVASELGID